MREARGKPSRKALVARTRGGWEYKPPATAVTHTAARAEPAATASLAARPTRQRRDAATLDPDGRLFRCCPDPVGPMMRRRLTVPGGTARKATEQESRPSASTHPAARPEQQDPRRRHPSRLAPCPGNEPSTAEKRPRAVWEQGLRTRTSGARRPPSNWASPGTGHVLKVSLEVPAPGGGSLQPAWPAV